MTDPHRQHGRDARATDRAGSVLILVVALLVLMALLGTAYISTTRIDRQTSAQHTKNVQIDMLVQGVVNQVTSAIQGDLYDASNNYRPGDTTIYRDPTNALTRNDYDDYDGFGFATPFDVTGNQVAGQSPNIAQDVFLARRMPWTQGGAPLVGGTPLLGAWPGVSYPLTQVTPSAGLPGALWQFDSPDTSSTANPTIPPTKVGTKNANSFSLSIPYLPTYGGAVGQSFTAKPWFQPVALPGVNYPLLQAYAWIPTSNPPAMRAEGAPFIAADADGDGVPDAGLVKLPIGQIDGVTYYYATRVIDNNSALNVNSAMSNVEYNGSGAPPGTETIYSATPPPYPGRYYTPASEGLAELLRTTVFPPAGTPVTLTNQGNEIKALVTYWLNGIFPPGVQGTTVGNPYPDNSATAIVGFQDQSVQSALNRLLGERPTNPGSNGPSGAPLAQAFSITDSMALAYHFGLLNPEASESPLESIFANAGPTGPGTQDSIYRNAPNYNTAAGAPQKWSAYPDTSAGLLSWYNQNFRFEQEDVNTKATTFMPRRTMFVASNPVSWQAPVHYIYPPPGVAPAYQRLDTYALAAGMEDYLPNAPGFGLNTPVSEAKVSINQAPFGDLWRAFWNVMAEKVTIPGVGAYDGSPFDLRVSKTANGGASGGYVRNPPVVPNANFVDSPTYNDPYLGTKFTDYVDGSPTTSYLPVTGTSFNPTVDVLTGTLARPVEYHPARMFRSPMRAVPDPTAPAPTAGYDARTPRLNADQVTLLRSAIAAVNAEDLRDSDDDVTSQRIILQPTSGAPTSGNGPVYAEATVYGTEPQPFITEIYADTATQHLGPSGSGRNEHGYVAVELYNPYDHDISLKNWKIVAIDRRNGQAGDPVPLPPYRSTGLMHSGGALLTKSYNIPLDSSTLIAELDPAADTDGTADVILTPTHPWVLGSELIVPSHGYLLLENYDPGSADGHRPEEMGLPQTGDLYGNPALAFNAGDDPSSASRRALLPPPKLPQVNVACVPGLSGMADSNWNAPNSPEWPVGIRSVFNREMVFLKPRRADGKYSKGVYPAIKLPGIGTIPAEPWTEQPNPTPGGVDGFGNPMPTYATLRDMVPVDSFDFTGLQLPTGAAPAPLGKTTGSPMARAWHYVRQNVEANGLSDWKFVYPGRYDATVAFTADGDPRPRQQGTQYPSDWIDDNSNTNPWDGLVRPIPHCSFGIDPASNGVTPQSNDNLAASYPTTFTIPLALGNYLLDPTAVATVGRNTIGESPLTVGAGTAQNHYPFGGFARNGDILATPFIGAYTIRYLYPPLNSSAGGGTYGTNYTVAEINPVTMDSVFAEDTDIYDDPDNSVPNADTQANGTLEREQVGRFCPVRVLINHGNFTTLPPTSDYSPYSRISFFGYNASGIAVNDFGFDPSYQPGSSPQKGANWEPFWRYHWANDLFDYLSVRSPSDDYLPNIPMQKEWSYDPAAPVAAQQTYYPGDLVSYFDNPGLGAGLPAHEIYLCTTQTQATLGSPATNSGFQATPLFTCRPVLNSPDVIAFGAVDSHAGQAAFRADPILIANAIQTNNVPLLKQYYYDAHREDNAVVQGLININTADWKVLSTLPLIVNPQTGLPDDATVTSKFTWFPVTSFPLYGAGMTYRQLNQEMAKVIEYYRDVNGNVSNVPNAPVRPHGPFRSIFELNQVVDTRPNRPALTPPLSGYPSRTPPGFQNGYWTIPVPTSALGTEPNDSLGDFSPADVGGVINTDGVRGDFEERNLQLTRISNMITTHSDSFTCYILVQGWRNAETSSPQLVVQRRVGYLIDRSRVTPLTPGAIVAQPFPNN